MKRLAGTSAHKAMTFGLKSGRDGRKYRRDDKMLTILRIIYSGGMRGKEKITAQYSPSATDLRVRSRIQS